MSERTRTTSAALPGGEPLPRRGRARRRGFALLLVLMVLMVMAIIVAQVAARVRIEYSRIDEHAGERVMRRALDSVIGLAVRCLTEEQADLRVDHLGDEWTRAKVFDVGDVRVQISIVDCARFYDLKPLLEEDPELLRANKDNFVAFAIYCGLDAGAAQDLADAIAAEAELRRLEDATNPDATTAPEQTDQTQNNADDNANQNATTATGTDPNAVPVWLEDFLSLSQLTDDDRRAILGATFIHEDPVTFEQTQERFLDLVTIWRYDKVNVNTAPREVLLYSLPDMAERSAEIDNLLARRAEEPFLNTAQVQSLSGLDQEQARNVARYCRLNSRRFRVTATASFIGDSASSNARAGQMTLILDRAGNNVFTILWRHTNL